MTCQNSSSTDFRAAIDRVIALSVNQPEDYNARGNLLATGKILIGTRSVYLRSIRLRNDFYPAYGNLINIFTATGKLTRAIATGHRAVALEPAAPGIALNLCTAYQLAGLPRLACDRRPADCVSSQLQRLCTPRFS